MRQEAMLCRIADRPTSVAYRVTTSSAAGVTETPLLTRCLEAADLAVGAGSVAAG